MRELVSAEPFVQVIKASKFLAELFVVHDIAQAKEIIAAQKSRFPEISHVVHAFVIGPTAGTLGCADDGEPAGTAGRPVLEVLQHSGLTDVMVTVIRWFGGTKLGTGGLVRAYSSSAQGVLANAVTREIVAMTTLQFELQYSVLESAKRLLDESGFQITNEEYGATGDNITGTIPQADAPLLQQRLTDMTRGQINFTTVLNP